MKNILLCQTYVIIETTPTCLSTPSGSIIFHFIEANFDDDWEYPFEVDWTHQNNGSIGHGEATISDFILSDLESGLYTVIISVSEECDITIEDIEVGINDVWVDNGCLYPGSDDCDGYINAYLPSILSPYKIKIVDDQQNESSYDDVTEPIWTLDNLCGGIYTISVTDKYGCEDVFVQEILEDESPYVERVKVINTVTGQVFYEAYREPISRGIMVCYFIQSLDQLGIAELLGGSFVAEVTLNKEVPDITLKVNGAQIDYSGTPGLTKIFDLSSSIIQSGIQGENYYLQFVFTGEDLNGNSIIGPTGVQNEDCFEVPYVDHNCNWTIDQNQSFSDDQYIIAYPFNLCMTGFDINFAIDIEGACNGDTRGNIFLEEISGGSSVIFDIFWILPDGSTLGPMAPTSLEEISSGTYSLYIINTVNLCEEHVTFFVPDDDCCRNKIVDDIHIKHVHCEGFSNGGIELELSSDYAPPLQFLWSNGAVTENIENLTHGSYSVTLTDANDCIEEWDGIEVIQYNDPPFVSAISIEGSTCIQSGYIDITVDGGIAPYSFLWSDGTSDEDISGIDEGVYCVTVTDSEGCMGINCSNVPYSNNIYDIELINLEHASDNGANGSIDIEIIGDTPPYSYTWSNGATTQDIIHLSEGFYTVTVTDALGCVDVRSYEIKDCISISIDIDWTVSRGCSGEATNDGILSAVIAASEPYFVTWYIPDLSDDFLEEISNDEIIYNLGSNLYTVVVEDGCGNTKTHSVELKCFDDCCNDVYNSDGNFLWTNCFDSRELWALFDLEDECSDNPVIRLRGNTDGDQGILFYPSGTMFIYWEGIVGGIMSEVAYHGGNLTLVSGPDHFSPSPGAYSILVKTGDGCSARGYETFGDLNWVCSYSYFDNLQSISEEFETNLGFGFLDVLVGCLTCQVCGGGLIQGPVDFEYLPECPTINVEGWYLNPDDNHSHELFNYMPFDSDYPCDGGILSCACNGTEIVIPEGSNGTILVGELISDAGYPVCLYSGGCLFDGGTAFEIWDPIFVEATITLECSGDPPTPNGENDGCEGIIHYTLMGECGVIKECHLPNGDIVEMELDLPNGYRYCYDTRGLNENGNPLIYDLYEYCAFDDECKEYKAGNLELYQSYFFNEWEELDGSDIWDRCCELDQVRPQILKNIEEQQEPGKANYSNQELLTEAIFIEKPIPFSNFIHITFENVKGKIIEVEIFSLDGRRVLKEEFQIEKKLGQVKLEVPGSIKQGLYLIKYTTANNLVTHKIVKGE
ncbi:T9SS type A sorting domain-containing protein [Reichenbachiella sp.]|uniref:T9SS type A sorting domain-containing protein n=1 Tax=Reichenbachiella sp. TaxID=2184521 RepID=UPI003B58D7F6